MIEQQKNQPQTPEALAFKRFRAMLVDYSSPEGKDDADHFLLINPTLRDIQGLAREAKKIATGRPGLDFEGFRGQKFIHKQTGEILNFCWPSFCWNHQIVKAVAERTLMDFMPQPGPRFPYIEGTHRFSPETQQKITDWLASKY